MKLVSLIFLPHCIEILAAFKNHTSGLCLITGGALSTTAGVATAANRLMAYQLGKENVPPCHRASALSDKQHSFALLCFADVGVVWAYLWGFLR